MTTNTEPGLLFVLTPAPALPSATTEALMEIPTEGQRAHITAILLTVVSGRCSLQAANETLSHERLDKSLVERLIAPMRETT